MSEYKLAAEPRLETGKGAGRRTRAQGRIPAVLYGHGMDPQSLSVDTREFTFALRTDAGANVLLDLQVGRRKHLALAKEIQRHPVRGDLIHVDFLAVRRGEKVVVQVPVHVTGEAPGVREGGGQLWQELYTVDVEAEVTRVPEAVEVSIDELQIGDVLRVGDLTLPAGVAVSGDPETTVLSVAAPSGVAEETAEETEAAPAAEPEAAGE